MTVIQNTELLPDGTTPVPNVVVSIKASVPAAMASGSGTVVAIENLRSDVSGHWAVDLIPNLEMLPLGTAYEITRRYPREYGGDTNIVYGIVPPSGGPYNLSQIVVGDPTATPLTSDELTNLLAMADPFPQYLREDVADERYFQQTDTVPSVPAGPAGGDLGGSYPNPTIDLDVVKAVSLDEMATPGSDLSVGGHKLTHVADGVDPSDVATVGQLASGGSGGGGSANSSPNIISKSANYNANPNEYVVMNSTAAARVLTLPSAAVGLGLVWVEQVGTNDVTVSGNIKGIPGATTKVGVNGGVVCFACDAVTWRPINFFYPTGVFARLDQDNDFGGHALKNYADDELSYNGATATIGDANLPWGSARQLTASGGCVVTVPASAPRIGSWIVLGQGSTHTSTIQVPTGGTGPYIVGTGGRGSPITTFDQNSRLLVECIDGTPGASGYLVSGGMA